MGFPHLLEMHPVVDKETPRSPLVAIIGSMVVFFFVAFTALGVPPCTFLFDALLVCFKH